MKGGLKLEAFPFHEYQAVAAKTVARRVALRRGLDEGQRRLREACEKVIPAILAAQDLSIPIAPVLVAPIFRAVGEVAGEHARQPQAWLLSGSLIGLGWK